MCYYIPCYVRNIKGGADSWLSVKSAAKKSLLELKYLTHIDVPIELGNLMLKK